MKSQAQVRSRAGRLAVVGCALSLGFAAACAAPEAPQEEEVRAEKSATSHHDFKTPASVVLEAARQHAGLRADQARTLDAIAMDLEDERESLRALRQDIRTSAVAVVRAGATDPEAFEQAVAETVANVDERVRESIATLEEIHGVLDADQRAAVAATLRARLDEKFGPKPNDCRADRTDRLASYLVLSKVQLDQLMTLRKQLVGDKRAVRPSRDELYALIDAFEGETFGEALETLHASKSRLLKARVTRASERTDTVLAIFTPRQRDLLADLLLEGPAKVLLGADAVTDSQM